MNAAKASAGAIGPASKAMSAHTVPRTATAFDFVECIGGRDRYIERMLNHRRKLEEITAVVKTDGPKAAFDGGRSRTPRPASPKSAAWQRAYGNDFAEVREAERRTASVKPAVDNRCVQPRRPEAVRLAATARGWDAKRGGRRALLSEPGARRRWKPGTAPSDIAQRISRNRRLAATGAFATGLV